MSCYEWERGTIKLPSAAVAPLKKLLREAHNNRFDQVLALAKQCHKDAKTTSVKKYRLHLYKWGYVRAYNNQFEMSDASGMWRSISEAHREAREVAKMCLWPPDAAKVRMPTAKDVAQLIGPKLTNKDSVIRASDDASMTFNGNAVTWEVYENNHAVDRAHEHPIVKLFFNYLEKQVVWTRGSGGVIIGNNEYNRDSDSVGGGGNYVVTEFGPKAAKPKPILFSYGRY